MAEQWPFKPFVESSTLSELTKKSSKQEGFFVVNPHSDYYSTLSEPHAIYVVSDLFINIYLEQIPIFHIVTIAFSISYILNLTVKVIANNCAK